MPQKKKAKKGTAATSADGRDQLPKSKRVKRESESEKATLDGETSNDAIADGVAANRSDNGEQKKPCADESNSANLTDDQKEVNAQSAISQASDNGVKETANSSSDKQLEDGKDTKSSDDIAIDGKEEAEKGGGDSTPDVVAGQLLICGGTNWDLTGRKELPKTVKSVSTHPRNLWGPHRWREKIRIKEVISSSCACHSVIITDKGQAMTFGRNDKGQLGLGDTVTRFDPVLVEGLKHEKIISAATGRGHTLFLTDKGTVYATGDNKMGQLGIGTQSSSVLTPARLSYTGRPIVKMSCGQEFSMVVDAVGNLYSFGSPEYGQLGHNSEGKYFTTGNKISYHCETVPRRVVVFIEKTREGHIIPLDDVCIVDVACGNNHTLAIDTKKRCFTWGFAGYGRLGHSDTKNELMPRNLKSFDYINRGVKRIWAGSTFSLALDENGILYFWGQTKSSGEATMYPKAVQDLSGWHIRSVGTANKSIVVAADESVISWGPSPTYGELGYGENKAKSSTTPQELKLLEGIYVHKVSCGYGHTLMIAKDDKNSDLIEKLPKWP